jgi:hypothetical protein
VNFVALALADLWSATWNDEISGRRWWLFMCWGGGKMSQPLQIFLRMAGGNQTNDIDADYMIS